MRHADVQSSYHMIAYLLYFTHQADHSSLNCAVYGLVNIIQVVL